MPIATIIHRRLALCFLLPLAIATSKVSADVKPAGIFGDHMVLQQQMPVPIWGTADAGEHVAVVFASQNVSTDADANGHWEVKLAPLTASNESAQLSIAGKNTIVFHDVLVGEVWICSGQSNMQFELIKAIHSKEEIAAADHPEIRLFEVPRKIAQEPMGDMQNNWAICGPQTVGQFSAVAYFFGRDLQKDLDVPVGLIHSSWGGTPAEAWTPPSYLQNNPELAPILENDRKTIADKLAKAATQPAHASTTSAKPPTSPLENPNRPSVLYNGMIAPIVPVALRGAIWYQGESNTDRAWQYRKLLPAMIQSWREAWQEPDMKFLIVSLANFQNPPQHPGESWWAELRKAQALTAAMPNNGQALAIDLADANNPRDIHPKNKQEVGRRLALVAEAKVYGKDVVYSGPRYKSSEIIDGKMVIHFTSTDGMNAKGGEPLRGFQIIGTDKKWVWADAKIDGDSVIVSSVQVKQPIAVRYDWSDNPQGNLYNAAGLPAEPFRTDDWPLTTINKR